MEGGVGKEEHLKSPSSADASNLGMDYNLSDCSLLHTAPAWDVPEINQ